MCLLFRCENLTMDTKQIKSLFDNNINSVLRKKKYNVTLEPV